MLAHPPINLNQQSRNATITLLQTLLDPPYSLSVSSVFVDALGPADKYEVSFDATHSIPIIT
jgi:ribonuclease H2 subunit A